MLDGKLSMAYHELSNGCQVEVFQFMSTLFHVFFHNDYRAFDNNFQKYILGFRLIILSHWCPSLPDFAGFGMHFNFTEVPYHYYDNAESFTHVHSAKNEVCAILRLQKCGYIGSDLTRNIPDFEKFCA